MTSLARPPGRRLALEPVAVAGMAVRTQIDLGGTGITIPRQAVALEAAAGARASVCSYGMSGTNAYAVLAAAQPGRPPLGSAPGYMISARSAAAAQGLAARYRDYLAGLEPGAYRPSPTPRPMAGPASGMRSGLRHPRCRRPARGRTR